MTTPPTTLHDRLRAELDRREAVARAAEPLGWMAAVVRTGTPSKNDSAWIDFVLLHDPADAIRRYEGELQVLQQHTWSDRDEWRYGITCNGCPNSAATWPCPEIRSLASRLGVNIDDALIRPERSQQRDTS